MKLVKAYAKRLKEILKEKNLNQYKLSKCSGVPQSTISTVLKGEIKTIKLSTIYDICAGLNIEFKDFFDCDYLSLDNIED
ncbi:MAG: helix-turn-helix transcriptional regulator [Clostridia bacterium]|nr:helix-turn-helix transcriptional regulator [Clostridia bacterium]MBQ8792691.1 helix-turn-helix transcriptional regulator [Clostridia bacterium]